METNFKKSTSNFQVQSFTEISILGVGLMETNFQLLMLSSNLLKSKIPMLRAGVVETNFQLFDAEFKFPKIQHSHVEGGKGACENQFPTFYAQFKFAKIQHSHVEGGRGA